MTIEFNDLNLHPELVQAVVDRGYVNPTPIQSEMIPVMLTGQDVIGQAQTGTGKTAAFALPMIQNLNPEAKNVQGLVLAPTRELAIQVAGAMYAYGKHLNVRVLAVYGGQPYDRQIRRLKKGVDIVVGTPGRLLDLIRQNALNLTAVRTVVLDEADEMLSMGFIEDIEAILKETPETRQTALFSATLPTQIRKLASGYMRTPHSITIEHKQLTVEAIEQCFYLVNEEDKLSALTRMFEVEDITSALIFSKTRVGSAQLANELAVRGFPAEALNGDLSQDAREQVLNRFRDNQIQVLVATDVAARGLDIDDISHVFNFDIPYDPEVYVHRVGRTGRAGKTGVAISLISPEEHWRLRRIEKFAKQTITQKDLPTIEEIQKIREEKLLSQVHMWLRRDRFRREKEIVEELVAQGHDPLTIAAAALKIARAEEKQRPIPEVSPVTASVSSKPGNGRENRRNRRDGVTLPKGNRRGSRDYSEADKNMVRLILSKGRNVGLRPNDVVGAIAYHADIPGHTIGKIRIQEKQTLVDVPKEYVKQVLAKDNYQVRKEVFTIERSN